MDKVPGIRPKPTLLRRLDATGRACFPAASTLVLLLALAAPLELPAQAELQWAVLLACVFFWSLFRPASMPPAAVFALGLLCDLLGDSPVGVTVLILLVTHGVAVRWHPALVRQGFVVVWLVFVVVAVVATSVDWALNSLLGFRVLPPGPVAFQAAFAVGLYPGLAALLTRANRGIAAPEEA